jgi:hypothetical protein
MIVTNANNESNKLKLHYKQNITPLNAELNPICHLLALLGGATIVVVSRLRVKRAKAKKERTFTVNIKVLTISSSHKDSNREGTKSVFHHFCPGLLVSLTFCPTR